MWWCKLPSHTRKQSLAGVLSAQAAIFFIAIVALLLLTACGFQLRGQQQFAFKTIATSFVDSSLLGNEFIRNIESGGDVRVLRDAKTANTADVLLQVLSDQREKVVVGVSTAGQVREFQLRVRLKFMLRTPAGKELIPETELLLQRDVSYNETAALSKESEEALLYRNMQSDVVQQLLRRLASVKGL
jgi:LPS-assembly lipoprotein